MPFFNFDLILLHGPSIYDFREKTILYGPISDVIPSTPIFEMYPIGFSSILEYLYRKGFKTRIVNLAYKMLKDKNYSPEREIRELKCRAFGIDLHWLPHAQGSLEMATICKRYHPDIPVIFGGYSASYFCEELIAYPQVDYVVRGDSSEEVLYLLLSALRDGEQDLSHIPNLTWKDGRGVHTNELLYVPSQLDQFSNSYRHLFRAALGSFDFKGFTSIHDWWEYPIFAVMTCRGCLHNCVFCGGSQYAVKKFCGRKAPAFRPPHLVAQDIYAISRYTGGPIFVVGDLRQAGEGYAYEVLKGVRKFSPANRIVLELFAPAPRSYFEEISRSIPHFNIEFSPESHLEEVRKHSGKHYSNREIEETIANALECGCEKFDLFFMLGLPYQTSARVLETIAYCRELLKQFGKRLNPFISPLAPFIDPGSLAYEESEKYGYKIFYRTLKEYRQALLQPSWRYTLGYETKWMTREELVDTTYRAALRLNQVKAENGLIGAASARKVEERIHEAMRMMEQIDKIVEMGDETRCEAELSRLKPVVDQLSISTICGKEEIKWPVGRKRFHFFAIAKDLLFGGRY